MNLFCTVGVHPHDAKHFDDSTINEMRRLLEDSKPFAVAVGECGLDYNRNFSSRENQLAAFREQVGLACELQLPIFVHEREAHQDCIMVLDEFDLSQTKVVVHCFTGNAQEAQAYIDRNFYIGFTGTICKKERGAPLRSFLSELPIKQLMVETDAPFMGFVKSRQRHSEPLHVVGVAAQLSRSMGIPFEEVCRQTSENAYTFFGIMHDDGGEGKNELN